MGTFELSVNSEKLSREIRNLLSEESINELAKETRFIVREGGKLDGFKFLDVLLYTHFNHKKLSLNDLSVQLFKRYGIIISKQSVDERFTNKAVEFFKKVLERVINLTVNRDIKIDFTEYDKVPIKDSTSFQLPENMEDKYPGSGGSASSACIRIQFEYDLKSKEILDLSLHPYTTQDMTNAKDTLNKIKPNELYLKDLGYIKIDFLREIKEKLAYYLNRLQSGTKVYDRKDGKFVEIDFWALYKKMRNDNIIRIDKTVYIGSKEKFETRIIIELLPEKTYRERMRKAKVASKKRGSTMSEDSKAKMGLNIFITNTKISGSEIRLLYTLRWQIELMFKIWKSIGEIDQVKKMKVERFETYLFAKLIWIVVNWQIMRQITISFFNDYDIEISPYKLFKTLKSSTMEFRQALKNGIEKTISFINEIIEISPRNHLSEKKKGSITWSYDIIRMF